jgi:hypothetical protein
MSGRRRDLIIAFILITGAFGIARALRCTQSHRIWNIRSGNIYVTLIGERKVSSFLCDMSCNVLLAVRVGESEVFFSSIGVSGKERANLRRRRFVTDQNYPEVRFSDSWKRNSLGIRQAERMNYSNPWWGLK